MGEGPGNDERCQVPFVGEGSEPASRLLGAGHTRGEEYESAEIITSYVG